MRRQLGVFTAGRILNPKTARSIARGHEYHVPVHADIPHSEVIMLPELDDKSSPMKAKGVGELGICGIGAAIANAIYHATGIRLRDYPFTPDKSLEHMTPLV